MGAHVTTTYRESARPEARVFGLRAAGIAGRAYVATMISLALTFALYVLSRGDGFVVLWAPVMGGALAWLSGLGPRAVEIGLEEVVVRSYLRPAQRIAGADLRVHVVPGELVLLGPATRIEIGAERFPEGSLAACADALRELAARRPT